MNQQKVFFASNIKFLRERKKVGQESLANALSFTRSKLTAIENGSTKALQPEDLLSISEFFKISIDSLLKVDLGKLGAFKLRELEAGNDVYMTGTKLRVLAITTDQNKKENVEYVPVKAKAGYRDGYSDPDFIATLPKYSFPNLPKGTCRMFPTMGDSMLPIPENSDILTQYVEDWTSLKAGTLCIVILNGNQDFVFKQVTVNKDGTMLLKSLNTLYAPYTVHADEVLEVWQFLRYVSGEVPEAPSDLSEIKRLILDVKNEIKKR
jgi:transcriptional regulator with XRE-family HTH domain